MDSPESCDFSGNLKKVPDNYRFAYNLPDILSCLSYSSNFPKQSYDFASFKDESCKNKALVKNDRASRNMKSDFTTTAKVRTPKDKESPFVASEQRLDVSA